jgi:hypothetical protein
MLRRQAIVDTFTPYSIEEVFALYLSRELQDGERVRFYVRLAQHYSLCLLLNALRAARRRKGSDQVEPREFLRVLQALTRENHLL